MERERIGSPDSHPVTVYYHSNPGLCSRGAAFHWWDAEYTSMHNHDHYEFFIITSGSTYHTLNGNREELSQKTLCLIRPQDCHQFTPLSGQRCIHINLSATEEKLSQLCQSIGTTLEQLLACHSRRILLEDRDFSFFKQNARELNYLMETGGKEELISMIIFEMLLHAVVTVSRYRTTVSSDCPEWLNRLLLKIHSPEYISCRVSDVYRLSGYSAPVVIRAFRQYTGETIVSYLTKARMDSARRLLVSTDLTVLDIAGRLGYSSLSHFNKLFRENTGMTPSEYRLQYQEQ